MGKRKEVAAEPAEDATAEGGYTEKPEYAAKREAQKAAKKLAKAAAEEAEASAVLAALEGFRSAEAKVPKKETKAERKAKAEASAAAEGAAGGAAGDGDDDVAGAILGDGKQKAAKAFDPKKKASSANPGEKKLVVPSSLSLHVSQLPFDTTKAKLTAHFEAHGCGVSEEHGTRLCFDAKGDPTGVAFVDVKDEKSWRLGLKLHRSRFGGRLVNVRPTRSPLELAEIVKKRDEAMATQGLAWKTDAAATSGDQPGAKRPRTDAGDGGGGFEKGGKGGKGGKSGGKGGKGGKGEGGKGAGKGAGAGKGKGKGKGGWGGEGKSIARPNLEALASREKWSKSKQTRERKKLLQAKKAAE
jgi:hypothetical protein